MFANAYTLKQIYAVMDKLSWAL